MKDLDFKFLQMIHQDPYRTFRDDDHAYCHIAILRDWSDFKQKGFTPTRLQENKNDPDYQKYCLDPEDHELKDKLLDPDDFFKVAEYLADNEDSDCYFSINSFWNKKKSTEDVRHLNAFVLDYDFYKMKAYKDLTPYEMYQKHIQKSLPKQPAAVIDSGRGLYVVYTFHHCSYKRTDFYQAVYKELYQSQKKYGMDPKAMNVTQVIRIPGTFNPKSLSCVQVLELNETHYELTDFADLLPYEQCQVEQYKTEKIKKKWEKRQKEENLDPFQTRRKREVKKLLDDFQKLIALRNRSGMYEGYREYLIFLALEKMLWSGYGKAEAIEIAKDLNKIFHIPLTDREVETQCIPSQIHYFTTSKNKMIRKLEMTDEEQSYMTCLRSTQYVDRLKKRMKSKHPLLNRTYKEIELMRRRNHVIELKHQGKTNKQIADHLGVSKVIITQDLNYIKEHLSEFRDKLASLINEIADVLSVKELRGKVPYQEQIKFLEWLEISHIAMEFT